MPLRKKKINVKNTPVRERILATALKLFYESGVHTVGVDKIVAEARVAKMTLYSYFASKEDLVFEYLEVMSEYFFEDFHTYLDKTCKTDLDRLMGAFYFLRYSFDKTEQYKGIGFVNIGLEMTDPTHPIHGLILENQEILRECFEHWARNGGLMDARELSYTLLGLFYGAAVGTIIEDFSEPMAHAIKGAERLIKAHRKEEF